jgi:thiosulfate/3-mercaptopyruvate sulfurtransferase
MKAFKVYMGLIALMIWALVPAMAQVAAVAEAPAITQTDIISAADFVKLSKANKDLVIVDASKSKSYAAAHIKDAIFINHNDLYQSGDISGMIKSPDDLAAFFGGKGITEKSEIVIYDDGSQKYSTRLYWILKYVGAENVKILHKDMDQWRAQRIVLTPSATPVKAVAFTPNPNPDIFADLNYVKERLENPETVLIDSRTPEEYAGTDEKQTSKGHIPGAINMNYEMLLTDTGDFKSAEELQKIAHEFGLTPDKELIFYCKTSVRGCVAFVAFRNILGFENVKVYDGAYNEWVVANQVVQ